MGRFPPFYYFLLLAPISPTNIEVFVINSTSFNVSWYVDYLTGPTSYNVTATPATDECDYEPVTETLAEQGNRRV